MQGEETFIFCRTAKRASEPFQPSIIWVMGLFLWRGRRGVDKIVRGVMLATYVHLVPKLSGAIPPHPVYSFMTCKDKGHPVTEHEDPEGEQRYSYTLSLISELDRGGLSAPPPRHFTPWKEPVPIVQEAG